MSLILDKENSLETKVQTRDGRKARIICIDRKAVTHPIVALVEETKDSETTYYYTRIGWNNELDESGLDLINSMSEDEKN